MNDKLTGKILFYLFLTAAAIFTGWRSWHLLTLTFATRSESATAMQIIIPWLGLAVFDGGCIAWAFWHRSNARGSVQRTLSFAGSALDGLGAIGASGFDTFIGGQTLFTTSPEAGFYALILVVVLTGINLAFIWAVHMFDPEAQDESAQQDVADEIRDEARKIVKRDKVKYAKQFAPQLAAEILARGSANFSRGSNGHAPEQAFEVESASDVSLLDRLRQAFRGADNGGAQTTHAAEVPAVKANVPNE